MHLRELLLLAADRFPDREAIVDGNRRVTYQQWRDDVVRLVSAFRQQGITPGDRVAIGMRNSLDHVTVFFALQALGAGAVPFNIRLKPESVQHIVNDSGAIAIVIDDSVDATLLGRSEEFPESLTWIDARASSDSAEGLLCLQDLIAQGDASDALPDVAEDDLSVIIYTSGTTGLPKGVPITHRQAYERLVTYLLSVGPTFDSGARTLGAAPLYHTVGMHWIFLQTIFVNGTYVTVPKVDSSTIDLIRDEKLTYLFGSPTLFKLLLEEGAEEPVASVQNIAYGSAPAEPELLEAMRQAFPNSLITEVYGTTELSIPFVTPSMDGKKPGTLRRTGDGRIRIVQPEGTVDQEVSPGELGELVVHMANPGVFSGYWGPDGEEKLKKSVEGEWFRTGDGFRFDADGNYFFDGRLDDMFVSGGENIQPAEIENVINGIDGILDCAVIGTPDPKWSHVITALVVRSSESVTETEIQEHCVTGALENYKRPRLVYFVDAIPRNPSGKIVRAEARKLIESLSERQLSSVDS